jgi:hypothetical protein
VTAVEPGTRTSFGVRLAKRWARLYTRGLDPDVRDARRAEIDSDIFEQQQSATDHAQHRIGAAIAGRTLRGALGDIAWRREERAMSQIRAGAPERDHPLTRGPARHLRWLALIPLVPAGPFLFFGILWTAPVQISVGIALVLTAMAIWRVFSGAWPLRPARD